MAHPRTEASSYRRHAKPEAFFSLLLAALLAVCCLSACGNAGSSPSASASGSAAVSATESAASNAATSVAEKGTYTGKDQVALYIHLYGHLPSNFITKAQARATGWKSSKGNLAEVLPGKSIGGDTFHNDDGELPAASGRTWKECDIDYTGGYRGAERIIFSNDGLVYWTDDHYRTFGQLY